MYCKDCKFWNRNNYGGKETRMYGVCSKFRDIIGNEVILELDSRQLVTPEELVTISDYIETMETFGCVIGEKKNGEELQKEISNN